MWEIATREEPYDEYEDLKLTQTIKIDKNSAIKNIAEEATACGWQVEKVDQEKGWLSMSQPNSFKIQDKIIGVCWKGFTCFYFFQISPFSLCSFCFLTPFFSSHG